MNKFVWALALSMVASTAAAQFAGSAPGAPGTPGQRGDDKGAAKGAPAPDPQAGRPAAAFGAQDMIGQGAAVAAAPTVNRMFEAIDANGDGVISKQELAKAATTLKKLDLDGDGNITLAEVTGPTGPAGTAGTINSAVDQTMTQYDKNKDGKLTVDEAPPEMGMFLRMADQNGDSSVNRAELAAAMEKMQTMWSGGQAGAMRGGMFNPQQMGDQVMRGIIQYDRNGDGRLTADELPPNILAGLQGADQNGDQAVDMRELQIFMATMGQRGARGMANQVGPMGDMQPMGNDGRGGVRRGR